MRESGNLAKVLWIGKPAPEVIDALLARESTDVLALMEARLPPCLFGMRTIKGLGLNQVNQRLDRKHVV